MMKGLGAILILAGCGSFALSVAVSYRRELRRLGILRQALRQMRWELEYRLTPLPELCRNGGRDCSGVIRTFFWNLARELDAHSEPEVGGCVYRAMESSRGLSPGIRRILRQMGRSLGRYDLSGQIQGLRGVEEACALEIQRLEAERTDRLRTYETLSLCAGAALVIVLI